jgi:outer membrane protein TolC
MLRSSLRALLLSSVVLALPALRAQAPASGSEVAPNPSTPVAPPAPGTPAAAEAAKAAGPVMVPEAPTVAASDTVTTGAAASVLSLNDCIVMAVKNNFDVVAQDFSTDIALQTVEVSKGAFDPLLNAQFGRNFNQAASTINTLDGTSGVGVLNDNTTASASITKLISESGTTVGLQTNVSRASTNSRFSTLNPSFSNGVAATVSQPLLKNFGADATRATLDRNKVGLIIAGYNYKSRVFQVIRDTEVAYNNLVSARETLRIRQLTLAYNQQLADENHARRQTGVATDLDVATAEVGVSNARLALVQAEQLVRNSEDTLQNLIGPTDFSTRPGGVAFPEYTDAKPSFAVSYKMALENSPDYSAQLSTTKQYEIDLAAAKRNRLPTLNLNGSVGYSNIDDSYGDVYNNLPEHHGNSWSVGVVYQMPWGQRADRARYKIAQDTLNQQKSRVNQYEQNLLVNVRSAVRAVETNLASVEIAAQATALSEQQYNLQKARFDAGLSTSRLVLQAQDDLETARFNELTTKVNLRNATAALHQLEGSSLQKYNIKLANP